MTVIFESQNSSGSPAEWATAGAAILALLISIWALWVARRSERRQLFIPLHDLLTSPEAQLGRSLLHRKLTSDAAIKRMYKYQPRKFNVVNRALGLYNTLGIYAHRNYVPRKQALDHWAGRVLKGWPAIERFLVWRRTQHDDPTMWSYLVWFAEMSGADVSPEVRLKEGWTKRHQPEDPTYVRPPGDVPMS